ncbi:hypothetical protein Tco_1164178 [Tanacetum coccineum]
MISTHLPQNSLKLRRPQPGRPLTQEKLLLAPPSKRLPLNLNILFDDVPIPDDVHISDTKDTDVVHLPKIKTRPDWLKPVPEEERPKTPEPDWAVPLNDLPDITNNWANAITNAYKDPEENKLIRKTRDIQTISHEQHFPLISDGRVSLAAYRLDRFGDKERRNALSISKLKAAYYLDFGLEELVPSLWIESECEYDISSAYSISHWWSKHKEFYITRHSAPSDHHIVLRRADYKEYNISEADFKNLHPNDFEDLHLLNLQGNLNHLFGADKNIVWSEDDKRRSKAFIEVIERRLKIRRISRNLESFVSGRLRDVDYRLIQRTE